MSEFMLPLIFIGMLFALIPVVALIVLQVYLSKMEKDWPGLVLPILSGCFSVLSTLMLLLVSVRGNAIITAVLGLVLVNIPTVVFTLIYFNLHKKRVPKHELDKMTIQDLS